jgi:hypothetical protein
VEIGYFHWRFSYTNRQWKLVSTGGYLNTTASGNIPVEIGFHWRLPRRAHLVFFTGA